MSYRFRLRPLTRSVGAITHGAAEYAIDVRFHAVPEGTSVQTGEIVTSDGRKANFVLGEASEKDGMRVFAGLVSDPFFMDVEAAILTDVSGKLSFKDKGAKTVQFRDVLSIVVELPLLQSSLRVPSRLELFWRSNGRCSVTDRTQAGARCRGRRTR